MHDTQNLVRGALMLSIAALLVAAPVAAATSLAPGVADDAVAEADAEPGAPEAPGETAQHHCWYLIVPKQEVGPVAFAVYYSCDPEVWVGGEKVATDPGDGLADEAAQSLALP